MITKSIKDNLSGIDKNAKFEFSELGMTWQVSHVRLIGGLKEQFKNIESFFLSSIFNDAQSSGFDGQKPWIERVNLELWAKGLTIEGIDSDDFMIEVNAAFKELREYEQDWGEKDRIDRSKIKIPIAEEIINAWHIVERDEARNPVGYTRIFVIETSNNYLSLERHWES